MGFRESVSLKLLLYLNVSQENSLLKKLKPFFAQGRRKVINNQEAVTVTKTETVLFNVSANLKKGIETVGGKLKITDDEIIFTPHKLNVQSAPVTINIGEINRIEKRNNLFIVPNGMSVIVKDGTEYKFVVNKRDKLVDHLNQTIASK
ncbi:GRAM domain-containing protein [Chungangia koreensis]|uniref:GRAM domain-containing protein n=1 Tax=Chungangia koreensis TaxID=752657 RepID=A0ABV8X8I8_9LACT